jgi:hypothetical protein
MVELVLLESVEVEDDALEVNEKERWEFFQFKLFFNDLGITHLATIISDDLRLYKFFEAFNDIFVIFNF